MKILIITPNFPDSLNSGGNMAQYYFIEKLRHELEISIITENVSENRLLRVKEKWSNVNIYAYNEATGSSKYNFKSLFKNLKDIALVKKQRKKPLKPNLQYWSISNKLSYGFVNFVENIVSQYEFDLIQIEFIKYISLVNGLDLPIPKLFIHHEIGFVRTKRELTTVDVNIYDKYFQNINFDFEICCLKKYDSIIVFSDIDKKILEKYIEKNIFISPFPVSEPNRKINNLVRNQLNIVFVGGELHYPNVDGVNWFITEIFFELKKLHSDISLTIIGEWSDATIQLYTSYENIVFTGYVEDIDKYLENSIMIVPIRIGSGIRTKILEAFLREIPVISTTIGIEGIPAIDKKHYLRADCLAEYVKIFDLLEKEPTVLAEIIKTAKEEIAPLYSIEKCVNDRKNIYYQVLNQ